MSEARQHRSEQRWRERQAQKLEQLRDKYERAMFETIKSKLLYNDLSRSIDQKIAEAAARLDAEWGKKLLSELREAGERHNLLQREEMKLHDGLARAVAKSEQQRQNWKDSRVH